MGERDQGERLMVTISKELDQQLADACLILGKKQSALVIDALTKYMEAISRAKGEKYAQAVAAIKAVRDSQDV